MKYFVWFLVVMLVVAHQDYWQWSNDKLVFGFLPYSLAYHAGISVAAAVLWLLAVFFCWPEGIDDVQPEPDAVTNDTAKNDAVTNDTAINDAAKNDEAKP